MAKRIKLTEALEMYYGTSDISILDKQLGDSVVPACCEDGCEVEPDGYCEHGHPSVLLAMGII